VDVLIVYGTTEGQTRKIAERSVMRVREHGHGVELYDSASPATNLDVSTFHAMIVAASVHQECHQDSIIDFAIAHRDQLSSRPTAFISVSLSAVLEGEKMEAQKYVDRFVATTRWQPQKTLLLGGALRFTEYDYFQQQIVKYVVMKRGGLGNTERDYEFTDWKALARFVDEFLEAAELRFLRAERPAKSAHDRRKRSPHRRFC